MKKIFISIYRFDEEYLTFINDNFKENENNFVSLFELKHRGVKNLIKEFTSYRKYDEIIIVFNDENYFLVKDLFYILSISIFSLNISKILPDKRIEKVSLLDRITSIFKILNSAIKTKRVVKKIAKDIELVNKKTRVKFDKNSKVFYLKTNLSFGTKAGGSLGHISGVVNSLAKKSDITYISAETPIMIDDGIKKVRISLKDEVYSVPYELNNIKINEAFLNQMDEFIKSSKPNIIYQRLTIFNHTGAHLSNKYKIPLIVEYNSSEVWVQNNWGTDGLKYSKLALDMEEYVLNSADTIITVSQVLQDELIKRGFDKEKIVFYPNCIDERVFDYKNFQELDKATLREKLGFDQNDKIFTFIGTFGAWHGVEFLANTIVRLVQNYKNELDVHRVKFLLIGDGLLGEKVRSLLETDETRNYVKFTGLVPQKDAPIYLSISDCFLSPHIKQKEKFIGSPTKLFEYMAFAKPIIASNLDQVGEIFEYKLFADKLDNFSAIKKESAIIFEPDNFEEFMQSILFVASHSVDKLGENAYAMVMQKYTWDVHVDKIINQFNR